MLEKLTHWQKSRFGYITEVVLDLALAYYLISLAIDSGRLIQYSLAILFLILAVRSLVKAIVFERK